jgi:Putative beta-barrel porin-2, OmpL-like. bbp2
MEDIVNSRTNRVLIVGVVVVGASVWATAARAQADTAAPPPSAVATAAPTLPAPPPPPTLATIPVAPAPAAAPAPSPAPAASSAGPAPFGFADWGWMNGQSRQTDFPMAGKVLNPMFSIDVGYNYDFSNPIDHSIVGSTSSGRSNELQIMHLGLGTDVNYKGARGRLMTQLGLYSTMTPRNDASPGRGQWNLADAYKYITEGYGGYHWDVNSGLNVDAGIFLSYVGLCSYYNYENWTNQASYVSSNTPWFFNGIRIQWFPTDKLKIEPWIINGWQSYGEFNSQPGLGFQIAYRPTGSVTFVFSGYYGKDTLGDPDRLRFHTDNSAVIKYFDMPDSFIDKAAFSLTVDAGCESGGGVSCGNGTATSPSQYFLGAMLYNRLWFDHNLFGLTVGGGVMTNPGRYLVLVPPINGATSFAESPYFSQAPGDQFKAWDTTETFDYMPSENITFRGEYVHRWANVPYFAGHGGVTPPGGNDGNPTGTVANGWTPDLQKGEDRITINMMVRI